MLEFYKQTQNNNINNLKNKFLTEITNKGKETESLISNYQNEIISKLPEPGTNSDSWPSAPFMVASMIPLMFWPKS